LGWLRGSGGVETLMGGSHLHPAPRESLVALGKWSARGWGGWTPPGWGMGGWAREDVGGRGGKGKSGKCWGDDENTREVVLIGMLT